MTKHDDHDERTPDDARAAPDDAAHADVDEPPPETSGGGCLLVIGVAVLLLVTVLPLAFATQKFMQGWNVRGALRTLAADEAGIGKAVVVRGRARDGAEAGPHREGAVAWIGEVGQWRRSGKSSRYYIQCVVTRIDGMQLETSEERLTLRGFDGHATKLAQGLALVPGNVAVDFWTDSASGSTTLPSDVAKVCELDDTPRNSYFYKERRLREGDDAVVRGCRAGDVLAPCRDGIDFVTSRAAADIAHDTKDEIAPTLLLGSFLALVSLGIAGLYGGYNVTGRKKRARAS